MVREERWQDIHRLRAVEHWTVSRIARELELDRKAVRSCLRQPTWTPYRREPQIDTLLTDHTAFLTTRAPEMHYSARILFQELRKQYAYIGGYDTVKRFVHPLRTALVLAEQATMRFETPPAVRGRFPFRRGQARRDRRRRPGPAASGFDYNASRLLTAWFRRVKSPVAATSLVLAPGGSVRA